VKGKGKDPILLASFFIEQTKNDMLEEIDYK